MQHVCTEHLRIDQAIQLGPNRYRALCAVCGAAHAATIAPIQGAEQLIDIERLDPPKHRGE